MALTAPPVDGKANAVCIEFFAKLLKVPRASVSIASGEASRSKVVRVVGLSADELRVGSRSRTNGAGQPTAESQRESCRRNGSARVGVAALHNQELL